MPKVGKTNPQRILGKVETYEIYYSSKNGFNVPKIPVEFVHVTGFKNRYTTEAELESDLSKCVHEYNRIKTTKRKIIAYQIFASTMVTHDKRGNSWYPKDWARGDNKIGTLQSDNFSFDGYAFGLAFEVLYQIDGARTQYFAMAKETDSWLQKEITDRQFGENASELIGREMTVNSDSIIIEWTPEREKALQDICDGLTNMAKKAASILTDQSKTLQLLDSGIKLLA